MYMAAGDKIKLAREMKGWSQEQLAASIGVEAPTISRWENGVNDPRPRHWPKLVNALGRTREWFEDIETDRLSGLEARVDKIENFENLSQINRVPDDVAADWRKAEEWQRDLARFFLTGNQKYLTNVKKEVRENILSALRFYKLTPSAKASQK